MTTITSRTILCLLCCFYLISSCSKEPADNQPPPIVQPALVLPAISTTSPSALTTTSITSGGKVDQPGNVSITDRGVCWGTAPNPTINTNKAGASSVSGDGTFTAVLSGLSANTTYYFRAYVETRSGIVYGNELSAKTSAIATPEMRTDSTIIIGANVARFGGTIVSDGGSPVQSKGVCFSTSPMPTVETGTKITITEDVRNYTCEMTGLTPNTIYYVRSFATNAGGTGYGNQFTFTTIAGGNVRYTIRKNSTPSADETDAYQKIEAAMNIAIHYYNIYTNINKVITVEYNTTVPTADGSINGNIRFGSGRVYMNPGTSMHEISHTVGVGTTPIWWSGSGLIVNGIYTGKHANALHQWITKDPNATILEDGQAHFKPYQFNVPNAPQTTMDYIYHALIMEGMRKDGLPIN